MTLAPRVSVCVPLRNEADNVGELVRRVGAVLDGLPGGPHELVLVDDGSTDTTLDRVVAAARDDPRIVVIELSRNFGHQPALTAALDHAAGDAIVLMDGDLQDPPELIPTFLARAAEGHDVVYARRVLRKEPWWLRACYWLFYRVLGRLADVRLPVDAGDFALLTRPVADAMRSTRDYHRYLRGLRAWAGFRQLGIDVERMPRAAGRPSYGVGRLLGLAFDGLFAFSIVPLRAAALLGGVTMVLTGGFALYALYAKLVLDRSPQGFTALALLMIFLAGVNLLFLGVMGEYVGRAYEQGKGRPVYVVRRIHGRGGDAWT